MKYSSYPQSGSIFGTTFSRNRFGQYARARAVPVQPRTATQLLIRGRMTLLAQAWRNLTAAQRTGWGDLGNQMQRTDSLGQLYNLTGSQAFQSLNMNNLDAGNTVVNDAPAILDPGLLATVTITLTNAAYSIAYTVTPLAAGVRLFVYSSPQWSAGRSFNGDYRFIQASAAAAVSPANALAAYTLRFGAPVTGNKIFTSVKLYLGGFVSAPVLVPQVVA